MYVSVCHSQPMSQNTQVYSRKELYLRMMFSKKVFWGATKPLRPVGILACYAREGFCTRSRFGHKCPYEIILVECEAMDSEMMTTFTFTTGKLFQDWGWKRGLQETLETFQLLEEKLATIQHGVHVDPWKMKLISTLDATEELNGWGKTWKLEAVLMKEPETGSECP